LCALDAPAIVAAQLKREPEPTDTVHVSAAQAVESRHFELGKTAAVVGISLAIPVAVLLVSVALSDDAVPLE
jgi:hypothetical protein